MLRHALSAVLLEEYLNMQHLRYDNEEDNMKINRIFKITFILSRAPTRT